MDIFWGGFIRNALAPGSTIAVRSLSHSLIGHLRELYGISIAVIIHSFDRPLDPFHRGNGYYRIYYARVVLILSPSPWDLLWDLYRLPYRSVAPSLSTQLIAFHRGVD